MIFDLENIRPAALRDAVEKLPAHLMHPVAALGTVVAHYVAAAYFTDTGEPEQPPASGTLAPAAAFRALKDCAHFLECITPEVLQAYGAAGGTLEQLGHDLWLTRNHHGAGFWDRDNLQADGVYAGTASTLGDYLTGLAHLMGECDLIEGDDGLLYLEGGV